MVLPHLYFPIINPLIPLCSRGNYKIYLGFHFKRDFLLPFFYIYRFLKFPYIKMYCLKGRRVTETENITTAASKNGRLMRRGQCITCGKKLRFNLLKNELLVEVFLTLW